METLIPQIGLRVAAVFATMNRSETAVQCVRALAIQTRPPGLVVVADNGSTDHTPEKLLALPSLPFELKVLRMPENVGNAGGVEAAMATAFELDCDAVWILDDDSWPRAEALAELLSGEWNPEVVRHSIQVDPKTGHLTWPMQVFSEDRFQLVSKVEELPSDGFVRTRIMWTGALVPRLVREKVGRILCGLFIRGEDEEYPWRFETHGFTQAAAVRSILDHPGPDNLIHFSMLGRNFFFEKGLSDWKLHYKVRNMVWLKLQQMGLLKALIMGVAYLTVVSRIDGLHRAPLVIAAIRDGLVGRLGKWARHP